MVEWLCFLQLNSKLLLLSECILPYLFLFSPHILKGEKNKQGWNCLESLSKFKKKLVI